MCHINSSHLWKTFTFTNNGFSGWHVCVYSIGHQHNLRNDMMCVCMRRVCREETLELKIEILNQIDSIIGRKKNLIFNQILSSHSWTLINMVSFFLSLPLLPMRSRWTRQCCTRCVRHCRWTAGSRTFATFISAQTYYTGGYVTTVNQGKGKPNEKRLGHTHTHNNGKKESW